MQVLIAISGFCPRIGNVPCTTPFDFLFVISIHVPTWGTTLSISTNLFALIFQSTFPRRERHEMRKKIKVISRFQSTFPRGERLKNWSLRLQIIRISIHVPSWGTTTIPYFQIFRSIFQSTFPRGERRWTSRRILRGTGISIHVPSWGTTLHSETIGTLYTISIHVPSWGTTSAAVPEGKAVYDFNPRSLVGNDIPSSFFITAID